jgi:hypothetical protein
MEVFTLGITKTTIKNIMLTLQKNSTTRTKNGTWVSLLPYTIDVVMIHVRVTM